MKTKLFLITLLTLASLALPVCAEILEGGVSLDWTAISQGNRDNIVEELKQKLFANAEQKTSMDKFAERRKDVEFRDNRYYIKNKILKLNDRKLAGFYTLGNKLLIAYGVEYEADKTHVYYYNALGQLWYIDVLDKPFDVYPNTSYQYDRKGKLKGVVYNVEDNDQYIYRANGEFSGRCFNLKCYNQKGKLIMTRTLPD